MLIRDQHAWNKYVQDNAPEVDGEYDYGTHIIQFAERWADLMEEKMASGARLEDVAKETSLQAHTETGGISMFQYGAAITTLADCWEHGEALRQWHCLGGQTGEERGILKEIALLILAIAYLLGFLYFFFGR